MSKAKQVRTRKASAKPKTLGVEKVKDYHTALANAVFSTCIEHEIPPAHSLQALIVLLVTGIRAYDVPYDKLLEAIKDEYTMCGKAYTEVKQSRMQ